MNKKFTSFVTAAILSVSLLSRSMPLSAPAEAANTARRAEYLDRGTVAVNIGGGVYLSWRLLGTEEYDTKFDVYRGTTKIASAIDATNYTDRAAGSSYTVVPAGEAQSSGKTVTVNENGYITIPLDVPASGISLDDGSTYTYSPNDVTPADVDGDGEYELILKWEPSNSFDSGKPANHSGNVYIDCCKMSGERLWRIDMGININAGAHFTQIAAYDFDLDGKAELAMKTAPGTVDGTGAYVSGASLNAEIRNTDNLADYRHSEHGINDTGGRVLSGPEFYTVFQGDTGAALDTIYYPHPRGSVTEWGDNWGNRSERYLAGAAYLDGKTPSMLAWRGYYEKTTVTAYNLVNKRLVQVADFDTSSGGNSGYAGNGNHNLTVGDVDGDGCDEIICGSLALDNDLSVLWCSGRGHGDALHLADYDPTHEGMEYFSVHEDYKGSEITGSTNGNDGKLHLGGMTLYKAENGEELFHVDSNSDQGRGMMANVGYTDGFFEIWGAGNYSSCGGNGVVSAKYNPDSANQRVFWDGDLYDELFDGTGSSDYGRSAKISGKDGRIQTLDNTLTNNGTKNNAALIADLLGDWREEIVMRGSDNKSLLVYTTTIPTNHKLYTLMHDSAYRMQVVCQNSGYNQPPHISYYVNDEDDRYDTRR
ncbi:MAG: rhamnogalacturonan lyase [Oscillospiraceae bacterium]|nr:rhamnogalacturonan lyase [Oscillospiraceae bacterium]